MTYLFDNHLITLDAKLDTVVARADSVVSGHFSSRETILTIRDLILSGMVPNCFAASNSKAITAMM